MDDRKEQILNLLKNLYNPPSAIHALVDATSCGDHEFVNIATYITGNVRLQYWLLKQSEVDVIVQFAPEIKVIKYQSVGQKHLLSVLAANNVSLAPVSFSDDGTINIRGGDVKIKIYNINRLGDSPWRVNGEKIETYPDLILACS